MKGSNRWITSLFVEDKLAFICEKWYNMKLWLCMSALWHDNNILYESGETETSEKSIFLPVKGRFFSCFGEMTRLRKG